MTPVEALKLALSKEEGSINLYKRLAKEHTVIRGLLESLLIEEQKHKKAIEKRISEITLP